MALTLLIPAATRRDEPFFYYLEEMNYFRVVRKKHATRQRITARHYGNRPAQPYWIVSRFHSNAYRLLLYFALYPS